MTNLLQAFAAKNHRATPLCPRKLTHKLSRRKYLREKLLRIEHHRSYLTLCETKNKIPKGLQIPRNVNPVEHDKSSDTKDQIDAILNRAEQDVLHVLLSHYNHLIPQITNELERLEVSIRDTLSSPRVTPSQVSLIHRDTSEIELMEDRASNELKKTRASKMRNTNKSATPSRRYPSKTPYSHPRSSRTVRQEDTPDHSLNRRSTSLRPSYPPSGSSKTQEDTPDYSSNHRRTPLRPSYPPNGSSKAPTEPPQEMHKPPQSLRKPPRLQTPQHNPADQVQHHPSTPSGRVQGQPGQPFTNPYPTPILSIPPYYPFSLPPYPQTPRNLYTPPTQVYQTPPIPECTKDQIREVVEEVVSLSENNITYPLPQLSNMHEPCWHVTDPPHEHSQRTFSNHPEPIDDIVTPEHYSDNSDLLSPCSVDDTPPLCISKATHVQSPQGDYSLHTCMINSICGHICQSLPLMTGDSPILLHESPPRKETIPYEPCMDNPLISQTYSADDSSPGYILDNVNEYPLHCKHPQYPTDPESEHVIESPYNYWWRMSPSELHPSKLIDTYEGDPSSSRWLLLVIEDDVSLTWVPEGASKQSPRDEHPRHYEHITESHHKYCWHEPSDEPYPLNHTDTYECDPSNPESPRPHIEDNTTSTH